MKFHPFTLEIIEKSNIVKNQYELIEEENIIENMNEENSKKKKFMLSLVFNAKDRKLRIGDIFYNELTKSFYIFGFVKTNIYDENLFSSVAFYLLDKTEFDGNKFLVFNNKSFHKNINIYNELLYLGNIYIQENITDIIFDKYKYELDDTIIYQKYWDAQKYKYNKDLDYPTYKYFYDYVQIPLLFDLTEIPMFKLKKYFIDYKPFFKDKDLLSLLKMINHTDDFIVCIVMINGILKTNKIPSLSKMKNDSVLNNENLERKKEHVYFGSLYSLKKEYKNQLEKLNELKLKNTSIFLQNFFMLWTANNDIVYVNTNGHNKRTIHINYLFKKNIIPINCYEKHTNNNDTFFENEFLKII